MPEENWYEITVVHHTGHPAKVDDSKPTDVIHCTVLPGMGAKVLRALADEMSPQKSVMRSQP